LEMDIQLESHCSHCPVGDSEIAHGPSGWTACMDTMRWLSWEDCTRQVQEDEEYVEAWIRLENVVTESEISEEPYKLASPATTRSMSLHPVSPLEGELEVDGVSITTRGTTPSLDENAIPLPVVCGVVWSTSCVHPGPYCIPATASHVHVDPTIVHHYVLLIIRRWPNCSVVQIGNMSRSPIHR